MAVIKFYGKEKPTKPTEGDLWFPSDKVVYQFKDGKWEPHTLSKNQLKFEKINMYKIKQNFNTKTFHF